MSQVAKLDAQGLERLDYGCISDCVAAIKAMRLDIMTWPDGEAEALPPRAQQDWLMALAHLELAACHIQQCDYHRMQSQ